MSKTLSLILALVVSMFAAEKHTGLYLRFQPGIGFGYANFEDLVEAYGGSGAFSMHIGGTVTDNLIVFGKFSSNSITNPTITILGSVTGESKDTKYTVNAFGAGLTYYLPVNFYLSGSLDIAMSNLTIGDYELESDAGVGMEISLGKEWFVSENWGLGLAFMTQFSKMTGKEEDEEYELGNVFFGLMFSATYN
jgi:hypothetical protein